MLDFPDVIDSDSIGQLDLRQRFPVGVVFAQRMPRPWRFHLVKQAKFHAVSPFIVIVFASGLVLKNA